MKNFSLFLSLSLSLILFNSCSSTKLVSSWRDPETTIDKTKVNKVLVMCLVKDETTRRVGEDELVKRDPNIFVASYTEYPLSALKSNADAVNDKISKSSYEGIIIMRLVSRDKATTYVPGNSPSYYGGWYGYYGYASPYYYDPGYYRTDEYYSVETNVYSLHPDKLIWTGLTETVNPGSIQTTIKEIADAVEFKMKQQKFLVTSK